MPSVIWPIYYKSDKVKVLKSKVDLKLFIISAISVLLIIANIKKE